MKTKEEIKTENRLKQRKYGTRYRDYRAFKQLQYNNEQRKLLDKNDIQEAKALLEQVEKIFNKIIKRNRIYYKGRNNNN